MGDVAAYPPVRLVGDAVRPLRGVAPVMRHHSPLWCLVPGHDWLSFSGPVTVAFLPDVKRLVKRICTRCGTTQYDVNSL